MLTPRALGYIPDLPDGRDKDSSILLAASPVPTECDNSRLFPSLFDQKSYSSCVGNAASLAGRASMIRQGAPLTVEPPSRLFIYHTARRSHGAEDTDAGTYIRSAFYAMDKVGFPPESAWPYSEPVNRGPNLKASRAAFDQRKPTSYYRIYEQDSARVDQCKRALAKGLIVVFGTDIDATFFDHTTGDVADVPQGPIVGGHALCLADFKGDQFRIANSWGYSWGQNGFGQITADWVAHRSMQDFWVCDVAPRYT